MDLSTNVFLYRLSSLHEARFGAGMGVDSMSFPISSPSAKNISKEAFAEIKGWLEGVNLYAEISTLNNGDQLDASGWLIADETLLPPLSTTEKPIVFLLEASSSEELVSIKNKMERLQPQVERFLLSFQSELNEGAKEQIGELCRAFPVLLEASFSPESIQALLEEVKPLGIALQGAEEIKVGLNDFDALADLLEALDTDEYL